MRNVTIRKNGFFVTYALFGIALITMVGVTAGLIYKSNQQSESRSRLKEQLQSDAMFVLQQINNCVILRPGGNNRDANSYDTRFPAQTADKTVSGLTCPAIEETETPTNLWNGSSSVGTLKLKPPPARVGYSEWQYLNTTSATGVTGVRLFIEISDAQSSDSVALLNSLRMRTDMADYFPEPVKISPTPARLYSINLSPQ
ncbi:MAG: hypothetical protein LW629_07765 [Burkholderiales bacterium]|nr:hypothetical protein [Burkholderiales bacterium]